MPDAGYVLDASALLYLLFGERVAERVGAETRSDPMVAEIQVGK
jgi:PIN domain nuclease of toxin-antitoxin system